MRLIPRFGRLPRCPLCREVVASELSLRRCSSCQTTLHQVCYEELGGCSTLGCEARGTMRSGEEISEERVRALRDVVGKELAQTRPWWAHTGLRGFLTASTVTGLGVTLLLLCGALFPDQRFDPDNPINFFAYMALVLGGAMFIELFTGRRA